MYENALNYLNTNSILAAWLIIYSNTLLPK
jgi:hypothetical protein